MIEKIPFIAVEATRQVFETMFYTTVEAQQEEEVDRDPLASPISSWISGEIGFEGRYSGRMIFLVPAELALTMASNFMGLGVEEISSSLARDVVGELCNMVCGNLFSRLDRKEVWTVTHPQTREISEEDLKGEDSSQKILIPFHIEGYPVKLEIQMTSAG